MDDGSDGAATWRLAQTCPDLRYHRQRRQGISKARNTGIRQARCEWLAFLDDDDEWLPDKLARQMEYVRSHPGASVVHCEENWFRNATPLAQKKRHQKPAGDVFVNCLSLCCISPSALLVHRRVFDSVGLFDETLPVCEDYDMWLRIASRYSVHCVRHPLLNKYGGHAGQLSRRYWGMDRFRIQALEKCLASGHLSEQQSRAARDMLVQKIGIYLQGARKRGQTRHVADFTTLLRSPLLSGRVAGPCQWVP